MPQNRMFTDDDLRAQIRQGLDAAEIARQLGASRRTVDRRIAKLERGVVVTLPDVVASAAASVLDARTVLQANYEGCLELLAKGEVDPIRVRRLMLRHTEVSLKVMAQYYQFSEIQAFQEEVLNILETMEPGARRRVIEQFQQRRSVRAAFVPGVPAISG